MSRKLKITYAVIIINSILPIIYTLLKVPESVQLVVVGAAFGSSGIYSFCNVWSKKVSNEVIDKQNILRGK